MTNYCELERHLRLVPADTTMVPLTFSEIERIIRAPLPASARQYRQWWANQTDYAGRRAWMSAGWRVGPDPDLVRGQMTFVRASC